ncbi:TRAP transporter small permease [Rapidithrix thailandica]|uniref:TRAP transporter small permease n=1 Tax=Rapidithrix thailandica TaxID=413964 RepID=A0AAW9SB23_9BACT
MLRNIIDKILERFLAVLMALMVLNVLWQVFSRYILKDPSSFTDELANFMLIWVGLLGASYATGKHMHLAIDLLPSRLQGLSKKRLEIFINAIVICFAVTVMVYGGGNLVFMTLYLEQTSPALQIQLGYIYSVLPLSGILIVFYSVLNTIDLMKPDKVTS